VEICSRNTDSYILPENPNHGPPPAKINIPLSMPFDKLPEDMQNQILPMLGLQPSDELKHEATINAVGKLSQAADHASNLLSAAGCRIRHNRKLQRNKRYSAAFFRS
jgi:hypothetical protein